jgi:hypothetical protein
MVAAERPPNIIGILVDDLGGLDMKLDDGRVEKFGKTFVPGS